MEHLPMVRSVVFAVIGGCLMVGGLFVMVRPDWVRRRLTAYYSGLPPWYAILQGEPLLRKLPRLANLWLVFNGAGIILIGFLTMTASLGQWGLFQRAFGLFSLR